MRALRAILLSAVCLWVVGISEVSLPGAIGVDTNAIVREPLNFWMRLTNDLAFRAAVGRYFVFSNLTTSALVGAQIGSSNLVTAAQVGAQIGSSNLVTAAQLGAQIGYSNLMTAALVGTQIGSSNLMTTALTAAQIASNLMTVAGVDAQIASSNLVSSYRLGVQIGASNLMTAELVAAQIASNLWTLDQVGAQIGSSNLVMMGQVAAGPVTYATNIVPAVQWLSIGDANTVTIDGSLGNKFALVLTTNVLMTQPVNLQALKEYVLDVRQDGLGNHTMSWDTNFWRFSAGRVLPVTLNAGSWNLVAMIADRYGTNVAAVQTLNLR